MERTPAGILVVLLPFVTLQALRIRADLTPHATSSPHSAQTPLDCMVPLSAERLVIDVVSETGHRTAHMCRITSNLTRQMFQLRVRTA